LPDFLSKGFRTGSIETHEDNSATCI
jgi:hypothetical protein